MTINVTHGGYNNWTSTSIDVLVVHTGFPPAGTGGTFLLEWSLSAGGAVVGSDTQPYPGADGVQYLYATGLTPNTAYYFTTSYSDSVQPQTFAIVDWLRNMPVAPAPIAVTHGGYDNWTSTSIDVLVTHTGFPPAGTGGTFLLEWSLSAGGAVIGSDTQPYPGADGVQYLSATGLTPATAYYFTSSYSDSVQPQTFAVVDWPRGMPVAPVTPIAVSHGGFNNPTDTAIDILVIHSGFPPSGTGGTFLLEWSLTAGGAIVGSTTEPYPGADGTETLYATGLTPSTTYYFTSSYSDSVQVKTVAIADFLRTTSAAPTPIALSTGATTVTGTTIDFSVIHTGFPPLGTGGTIALAISTTAGGPPDVGTLFQAYPGADGTAVFNVTGLDPATQYFFKGAYSDSVQPITVTPEVAVSTAGVTYGTTGVLNSTPTSISIKVDTAGSPVGTGSVLELWWSPTSGGPYTLGGVTGAYPGPGLSTYIPATGLTPGTLYHFEARYTDTVQSHPNGWSGAELVHTTPTAVTIGTLGYNTPTDTSLNIVANLGGAVNAVGTGGSVLLEWSLSAGGPVVGSSTTAYPGTDGSLWLPATGLTPDTAYYFTASYSDSVQPRTEAPEISVPTSAISVSNGGFNNPTDTSIDVSVIHSGFPSTGTGGTFLLEWSLSAGGPVVGSTTQPYPGADGTVTLYATGLTPSTTYYFTSSYSDSVQSKTVAIANFLSTTPATIVEYKTHLACVPYVTAAELLDCCAVATDNGYTATSYQVLDAIEDASLVLYYLTGRQFDGACTIKIRPCVGCQCDCDCFDCTPNQIDLGVWPVTKINSIRMDGIDQNVTDFHIDEWHYLVANDPSVNFQKHNNMNEIPGGPTDNNGSFENSHVFEIDVTYGLPVPRMLTRAARQLACELLSGCPESSCDLPELVTSVSRRGMTMEVASPMDLLEKGRTGLYAVDLAISTFNPSGLQSPSFVWSPDMASNRIRKTHSQ
jgi:hypothetical protein